MEHAASIMATRAILPSSGLENIPTNAPGRLCCKNGSWSGSWPIWLIQSRAIVSNAAHLGHGFVGGISRREAVERNSEHGLVVAKFDCNEVAHAHDSAQLCAERGQ